MKKIANQKGFTLFEIVVALSVFAMATIFVSDIFVKINASQRKVAAIQKVQSDARFAMEAISREVKQGRIDYSYYPNGTVASPVTELAILDALERRIIFKKETEAGSCPAPSTAPCLLVSIDRGETWVNLLAQDLKLAEVNFYVSPSTDPFSFDPATGAFGPNFQPRVTIVLAVETGAADTASEKKIYLETTISSRMYKR